MKTPGQCDQCRWWDADSAYSDGSAAICRRYPPTGHHSGTHWPRVKSGHWCGEFEPRPATNEGEDR